MRPRSSAVLALLAFATAAWTGASGFAASQPAAAASVQHDIPQSLVFEHEETLKHLAVLARRPGQVGSVARKALGLFKRHIEREQAYILPPLTLLPDIADGKATPDMAWALAMADRVKADREAIFNEHTQVTDAMNALFIAAERAHDKDAMEFARAAEGDSLNDIEILEPAVLLVGDYLRSRLPASH
jgi:hypothetical protein